MKYPSDFERVVGFDGIRASIALRCKYPSTQDLVVAWEMQTTHEAVMLQLDLLDQIHQLNELLPSVLQFQGDDISGCLSHLSIENYYLEEEALAAVLAGRTVRRCAGRCRPAGGASGPTLATAPQRP